MKKHIMTFNNGHYKIYNKTGPDLTDRTKPQLQNSYQT